MGHYLNAFLGRPAVLAGLARDIRGLRLVPLPQGLALAPLPSALGDAVTLDHGPPDGWRELDHDLDGVPHLGVELEAIAAEASRQGPVGWLKSGWFGGHGDNTVALWRDGQAAPVEHASDMLAALGAQRVPVAPDPGGMTPLSPRRSGAAPATLDLWDSLDLGAHRDTWRAWSSAVPVEASGPTPAQRAMLAALHARLGALALSPPQDVIDDIEQHRVIHAYLFETCFLPLRVGRRRVWVFTGRRGGGLGALLPADPSDHGDDAIGNLELHARQEEGLRAKGWRLRWARWEAAWPDAEQAAAGVMAVAGV